MATVAPIREPANLGPVISGGLRAIRRFFLPFASACLLVAAVPLLGAKLFEDLLSRPFSFEALLGAPGLPAMGLLSWLLTVLLNAFLIHASLAELAGRPVDLGAGLAAMLRRLPSLAALSLVSYLLILVGLLLLVVPGVIAMVLLVVCVPAMIAEGKGIGASMARSRDLTRGSRRQVAGLIILFFMASWGLGAVIDRIVDAAFAGLLGAATADAVAQAVGAAAAALLAGPMTASLYVELRNVQEGAPTDELLAVFE